MLGCQLHRLTASLCFCDDGDVAFGDEQCFQPVAHDVVVVCQQNGNIRHKNECKVSLAVSRWVPKFKWGETLIDVALNLGYFLSNSSYFEPICLCWMINS